MTLASNDSKIESRDLSEESFRGDITRLGSWLKRKKTVIIVVVLWTAILSIVVIGEYYSVYLSRNAMDQNYRVAFAPTYSQMAPRLYSFDYIIIILVSLLAGFAINDIEDALFGFLASVISCTIVSVAYSAFFIWYVLGFGAILDISFVSTILWAAFLNIFRMVFPLAVLMVFIASISGSIIRDYVQPYVQD